MAQHSTFGASSAHRWVRCPGSIALTKDAPRTESAAALAGTIGHEVADICIRENKNAYDITTVTIDGVTHDVPEDTQVDVNNYIEFLRSRGGTLLSEVQINYATLLGVDEAEGFGTSDAVILLDNGDIEIHDLKLGRKPVDAEDNKQLILYAAGVADTLESTTGEPVRNVTLGIYQPNVTRFGTLHEMSIEEVQDEVKAYKNAATQATASAKSLAKSGPTAKFYATYTSAGESQCQWCKHAAACPTLLAATKEVVNACTSDDFDIVSAPSLIDDAPVRAAYESLDLLRNFITAVEDEVYARASAGRGESVGVKFVAGKQGNRKWTDETVAATQLSTELPVESVYTKSLISPAVAEKALKKAKVTSIDLSSLVSRSAPSKTIAPINDPRPEWTGAATTDDFN
jgi:hypothetical protein